MEWRGQLGERGEAVAALRDKRREIRSHPEIIPLLKEWKEFLMETRIEANRNLSMKEVDLNDQEDFYIKSCLRERFEYGDFDLGEEEPECCQNKDSGESEELESEPQSEEDSRAEIEEEI